MRRLRMRQRDGKGCRALGCGVTDKVIGDHPMRAAQRDSVKVDLTMGIAHLKLGIAVAAVRFHRAGETLGCHPVQQRDAAITPAQIGLLIDHRFVLGGQFVACCLKVVRPPF